MRCVASENVTSSHRTRRPCDFSLGVTYQRMSEAHERIARLIARLQTKEARELRDYSVFC